MNVNVTLNIINIIIVFHSVSFHRYMVYIHFRLKRNEEQILTYHTMFIPYCSLTSGQHQFKHRPNLKLTLQRLILKEQSHFYTGQTSTQHCIVSFTLDQPQSNIARVCFYIPNIHAYRINCDIHSMLYHDQYLQILWDNGIECTTVKVGITFSCSIMMFSPLHTLDRLSNINFNAKPLCHFSTEWMSWKWQ